METRRKEDGPHSLDVCVLTNTALDSNKIFDRHTPFMQYVFDQNNHLCLGLKSMFFSMFLCF